MSYCRFSSANWKSDVYVYASVSGGYVCHVAQNRRVHPEGKECPSLDWTNHATLKESYDKQVQWLDEAELAPIESPLDTSDFSTNTAKEMAERLRELALLGYYVPDGVVEALLVEEEDECSES